MRFKVEVFIVILDDRLDTELRKRFDAHYSLQSVQFGFLHDLPVLDIDIKELGKNAKELQESYPADL